MIKFYLMWFLPLLCIECYGQARSDKVITIHPYLSFQNYEHFKRLTLSSDDSPAEYIEGFDFEWGYCYSLSLKETTLNSTLSDGTQYEYSLNTILSKTKAPDSTLFKLYLDSDRYYYEVDSSEIDQNATLKQLNDSVYMYFDEVEIEVPGHLKDEFNKLVLGEFKRLGFFIYINEKRIGLVSL